MAELPVRQRIVVPFNGHTIGEGFNSDSAERVGTGLNVGFQGEDAIAPGATGAFRFHMLTSQQSLEKSLNISAEVEARYALFSGGAKFDFSESSALNTSSTYVMASAVIQNALRRGRDLTPTEDADRLIRAGDIDGFKTAFGDRFTQALRTGGEFYAVFRITSSNSMHQSNISAALHGEMNGLVAGGSFEAALKTAKEDASSHFELDIQIYQTGGVGDDLQIPGTVTDEVADDELRIKPSGIIEHMNRFAKAAHENAAAYEAELVTYDTLALPFPPLMELEDRRFVLEDCLARRQRYLSAISELEFALSENADLIFENVLPRAEIVRLQSELRSALGDLMAHARGVSSGIIEPQPFVIVPDPLERLPRFKRRNPAGSFAIWWAKAKDKREDLLQDELFMITRIANQARGMLPVPLLEAQNETVERAADSITVLDLTPDPLDDISEPFLGKLFCSSLDPFTLSTHRSFANIDKSVLTDDIFELLSFPPMRSIAALPTMIDAPLRLLQAQHTQLEDLSGLERFSRLEFVNLSNQGVGPRLRDINALASVSGLVGLSLVNNNIRDLSPLRTLTRLEQLFVAGNQIESLEPLGELHSLGLLGLAAPCRKIVTFDTEGNDVMESVLLENPIADARALARLPRLANPLTSADRLRLTILIDREGEEFGMHEDSHMPVPLMSGVATRIGATHRFRFTSESGESQEILLVGLCEFSDLTFVPAPIVVTALHFRDLGVRGVAATQANDRSAGLDGVELAKIFHQEGVIGKLLEVGTIQLESEWAQFFAGVMGGASMPKLYIECEAVE